jgi:hypothetical protein
VREETKAVNGYVWAGMGVALLLAACDRPHGIYAETAKEAARPTPSLAAAAGAPLGYVGRWASSTQACASRAWVFSPGKLTTPAGAACDIVGATPTTGGYSANSSCTAANGNSQPGRLVMTITHPVAGHANTTYSMTISEGPFGGPINLIRCAA